MAVALAELVLAWLAGDLLCLWALVLILVALPEAAAPAFRAARYPRLLAAGILTLVHLTASEDAATGWAGITAVLRLISKISLVITALIFVYESYPDFTMATW